MAGGNTKFTVRGAYKQIEQKRYGAVSVRNRFEIPKGKLWQSLAPSRTSFLLRLALRGKTLTQDKLKARRCWLPSRCITCGNEGITM